MKLALENPQIKVNHSLSISLTKFAEMNIKIYKIKDKFSASKDKIQLINTALNGLKTDKNLLKTNTSANSKIKAAPKAYSKAHLSFEVKNTGITDLNKPSAQTHLINFLEDYDGSYNLEMQKGGEQEAIKVLDRFFEEKKYLNYINFIASPLESREFCSRLSAHLAWGNISLRQVFQRLETVLKTKSLNARAQKNLDYFRSRLFWRAHFIQKFETQVEIEDENINPAFNVIQRDYNPVYIDAFEKAQTGFPLIDACIKALNQTGYLNFRMRAMICSFFTHILFQDWRLCTHYLARQFLDYEPGIHYPQHQMQAGTTGINIIRIYNPFTQTKDHDPEFKFIKKYLPELKNQPASFFLKPRSKVQPSLFKLDYPMPIVDFKEAYQRAKEKLYTVKNSSEAKSYKPQILAKLTNNLKRNPY
jgi:deoxyribodipyrimidine photo-lyase